MKNITKFLIGLLCFLSVSGLVVAASTVFVETVQTSANPIATSTITYMTPGTATTTLTYDSFHSGQSATNGIALLLQVTASTSQTQFNINEEYSQDGIDWYQGNATVAGAYGYATTSLPVNIGQVAQYQWQYSTSTPGLGANGAFQNTDNRIINLPTPTRFIRAIITLKIGGANGGVWAQLIPMKTQPQ